MQTEYNTLPGRALAGGLVDSGPNDVLTRVASTVVFFGRAAANDGADNTSAPNDAADLLLGVALRSSLKTNALVAGNDDFYEAGDCVNVLRKGRVWVELGGEFTAPVTADDVFVHTVGLPQVLSIVFDADFVTDNVINLELNGVAMTEVPFDTDNDTTLTNLATQIATDFAAVVAGAAAVVTDTVNVTSDGNGAAFDVTITDVLVTAGASQAVATVTETQAAIGDDQIGTFTNATATGVIDYSAGNAWTGRVDGDLAELSLNQPV